MTFARHVQEHGAKVTATDLLGNTAVHEASTGAKIDILKQLVAKGADLTIANNAGETCLHVAARHKSTQTVSYLVKEGAPVRSLSTLVCFVVFESPCCFVLLD